MQFLKPFFRYFEFSGRSGRAEFWQYIALLAGVGIVLILLDMNAVMQSLATGVPHVPVLMLLFNLGTVIPTSAVIFRRLHDRGFSGWMLGALYLSFVPLTIFGLFVSKIEEGSLADAGVPLLSSLYIAILVYELYLIVQLALPGDEWENSFGLPDNEPLKPFFKSNISQASEPLVYQPNHGQANASSGLESNNMETVINSIKRFSELNKAGYITDAEFGLQKARLLSGVK